MRRDREKCRRKTPEDLGAIPQAGSHFDAVVDVPREWLERERHPESKSEYLLFDPTPGGGDRDRACVVLNWWIVAQERYPRGLYAPWQIAEWQDAEDAGDRAEDLSPTPGSLSALDVADRRSDEEIREYARATAKAPLAEHWRERIRDDLDRSRALILLTGSGFSPCWYVERVLQEALALDVPIVQIRLHRLFDALKQATKDHDSPPRWENPLEHIGVRISPTPLGETTGSPSVTPSVCLPVGAFARTYDWVRDKGEVNAIRWVYGALRPSQALRQQSCGNGSNE